MSGWVRISVGIGIVGALAASFQWGRKHASGGDLAELRGMVVQQGDALDERFDLMERRQAAFLTAAVRGQVQDPNQSPMVANERARTAAVEAPPRPEMAPPDPAAVREHVEQGRLLVTSAIAEGGSWTKGKREALAQHLNNLPPADVHALMHEVVVALNDGKLRMDGPGSPF